MRREAVSRRALLLGVLVGAVGTVVAGSGCQNERWHPYSVTPDESALLAAITTEQRMVARYEAALSDTADNTADDDADDDTEELLTAALEAHEQHLTALRARLPPDTDPDIARAEEDSDSVRVHEPAPLPDEPPSLAALQLAEQDSAAAHTRRITQVGDGGLAQLFASMGAAAAGHAHLIAQL